MSPRGPDGNRHQDELDDIIDALDALRASTPNEHFDASLRTLNDRIDAVDGNYNHSNHSNHNNVHAATAIARSRPKPTASGDCEPMSFDVAYWRSRQLASVPTAAMPQTPVPNEPQSSLSDECLRDMVELVQDGFRVEWPDGLDLRFAKAILISRAACSVRSGALGHPPGVYHTRFSPDGATSGVQTRRIGVETSDSCNEAVLTAEPPSSCTASPALTLDRSLPNSASATSSTLLKPIRETSVEQRVKPFTYEATCTDSSSSFLGESVGNTSNRGSAGVFGKKNQRD